MSVLLSLFVMVVWYSVIVVEEYLKLLRFFKIILMYGEQKLGKHLAKIWKCKKPERNHVGLSYVICLCSRFIKNMDTIFGRYESTLNIMYNIKPSNFHIFFFLSRCLWSACKGSHIVFHA